MSSRARKRTSRKPNYFRILKKIAGKLWDDTKLLLIVVLGAILFFQWLNINIIEAVSSKIGFTTQDKLKPLKDDEQTKLTVNVPARRAHVQTKDGKTKTYHGVRKVEATQLIDGSYTFSKKNIGLGLEPGFISGVGDGFRAGADVQFAYWKQFGLAVGFTSPVQNVSFDRLRIQAHMVYHPGFNIAPNTGVYVGADSNKTPVAGVRLRF